jgi:hypothetical protein
MGAIREPPNLSRHGRAFDPAIHFEFWHFAECFAVSALSGWPGLGFACGYAAARLPGHDEQNFASSRAFFICPHALSACGENFARAGAENAVSSFTNSVHLHEQFHSSIFRKLLRLRRATRCRKIVFVTS